MEIISIQNTASVKNTKLLSLTILKSKKSLTCQRMLWPELFLASSFLGCTGLSLMKMIAIVMQNSEMNANIARAQRNPIRSYNCWSITANTEAPTRPPMVATEQAKALFFKNHRERMPISGTIPRDVPMAVNIANDKRKCTNVVLWAVAKRPPAIRIFDTIKRLAAPKRSKSSPKNTPPKYITPICNVNTHETLVSFMSLSWWALT